MYGILHFLLPYIHVKYKRTDALVDIHRQIQKAMRQYKSATKNLDYTTISEWLRTVCWSNDSHPTSEVDPAYEISTFPLTAKVV